VGPVPVSCGLPNKPHILGGLLKIIQEARFQNQVLELCNKQLSRLLSGNTWLMDVSL
jgi:hypothetical protein